MKTCFCFFLLFVFAWGASGQEINEKIKKTTQRYMREGYQSLPGLPSLKEQVAEVEKWRKNIKTEGNCLMVTVTAKGSNYNAAKIQAENLARIEITGRVKSRIANITETKVSSLDQGQRGSGVEAHTRIDSKTIAALDLADIEYPMELFRKLKSGETEIILVMVCKVVN